MSEKIVVANPLVVLREEFDDWAVLFDPSSGEGFVINPISLYIWKLLDGKHTIHNILEKLRNDCDNVPDDAEIYVQEFIQELINRGLAGYEV